jgi:tetratricopeptide (TPR) repeat protein
VPQITASTVSVLARWIDAIEHHTPGQPDAAVATIWALTLEDRKQLNNGLRLFLTALSGHGVVVTTQEQKWVAERGKDIGLSGNGFVKRGATLHADAVMLDRFPVVQPPSPGSTGRVPGMVVGHDGEYTGGIQRNWNWPLARNLISMVRPQPASDPFVAEWYHATTAYMLRNAIYGEAGPHLEDAAVLLPDDARILLDRGCLSEALGMPASQQLLTDVMLLAARLERPNQRSVPGVTGSGTVPGLPPAEVTNAAAERFFRRAIEMDPAAVEARVRLARLLEIRKRFAEAASESSKALALPAVSGDAALLFYGHLFAGRADRALGRLDDAAAQFAAAVALFPDAQSALLGQSQVALLRADAAGALAPIQRLAALPINPTERPDPWWRYATGPGRNAEALLTEMWKKARL